MCKRSHFIHYLLNFGKFMRTKIWKYVIASMLIFAVLLSSITSPYQFVESIHSCVHKIGSLVSDHHGHAHSHDFLDLLEQHHEGDSQQDAFVLDKNASKIINEIFVFNIELQESNFHTINSRIIDMLDSYYPMELDDPPKI